MLLLWDSQGGTRQRGFGVASCAVSGRFVPQFEKGDPETEEWSFDQHVVPICELLLTYHWNPIDGKGPQIRWNLPK